jgi:hypothetical protein
MRLLVFGLMAGTLAGCEAPQPPEPSEIGRYQIVFSPRVERNTFRLDTVDGETYQLVDDKDGNSVWQKIPEVK